MKSLLIVSHGSRRKASNEEVLMLTNQVHLILRETFPIVNTAYLELASPSIPEGIEACINEGATDVLVLPYFLAAGRHVSEDIPSIVESSRQKHPTAKISIAQHVGGSDFMVQLIADHCQNQP